MKPRVAGVRSISLISVVVKSPRSTFENISLKSQMYNRQIDVQIDQLVKRLNADLNVVCSVPAFNPENVHTYSFVFLQQ